MIYLFFNEDDKILWFYHMKYFNMIIGKTCLIALMFIKLVIHLVSCVYNIYFNTISWQFLHILWGG